MSREERGDGVVLRASHDGYADRFGVLHQRALMLVARRQAHRRRGPVLPADGDIMPQHMPDEFAVRFHLHPAVKANKLTDGHGVMLMLPNRDVWTFNAYEDRVELEESVYLVRPRRAAAHRADRDLRPRPQDPRVHWSFAHVTIPSGATGARRGRSDEPELPL